jgi:hypothetical protein
VEGSLAIDAGANITLASRARACGPAIYLAQRHFNAKSTRLPLRLSSLLCPASARADARGCFAHFTDGFGSNSAYPALGRDEGSLLRKEERVTEQPVCIRPSHEPSK